MITILCILSIRNYTAKSSANAWDKYSSFIRLFINN